MREPSDSVSFTGEPESRASSDAGGGSGSGGGPELPDRGATGDIASLMVSWRRAEISGDSMVVMEPVAAGELFPEAARLFDPVPGMSARNREVVTYNREYSYRSARFCYACLGDDEAVARVTFEKKPHLETRSDALIVSEEKKEAD